MPPKAKSKIVRNYEYLGLGFPVVFPQVELRFVLGEWMPHIDMRKLQEAAFEALMDLPAQLTGAQVAFIRSYMGQTQEHFAKCLGLTTHVQISRWEKAKGLAAGLSPGHEANLRILMRGFLGTKTMSVQEHLRMLTGGLTSPVRAIRLSAA